MNTLSINGSALADIYVDASLSFNKPSKDVETFRVPGRSGALIIDNGTWDNLVITYPCFTKSKATFEAVVNQLGAMQGYQKIECSSDSTHFRMGEPVIPQAPEVHFINQRFYFDLSFNCKPQRFLTSGETVTTKNASGSISNPTLFSSKPLLRIYGNGTVTVNGTGITLTGNTGYTDVDCEAMECYYGTTNRNGNVSFSTNDFPVLSPGNNTLTFGSGITQLRITPRWWEL